MKILAIDWLLNPLQFLTKYIKSIDPLIGAALITGGAGLLGSFFGGGDDETQEVKLLTEQLADYPEAETARKDIASKLEEWGAMPGYGAISPDWEDIWERARGKVGRYYWGGPGETGLAGRVRAGAARRGVSESPAMGTLIGRMGQQEAIQLGEMGTEQALQESLFGEKGRQTWFGQMQNLAGMKPAYASTGSITTGSGGGPSTGEMIGGLGSAVGGAFQQYGQNQWIQNYLKEMLGGGQLGVANPIGGYGGAPATFGGFSTAGQFPANWGG